MAIIKAKEVIIISAIQFESNQELFKSEAHHKLFGTMLVKLNELQDNNYVVFAYLAAATEKVDVRNALSDHHIDFDQLEKISKNWSNKDKILLKVASNLFTSGGKEADINSSFKGLNASDSAIVIVSLTYIFNIKANIHIPN